MLLSDKRIVELAQAGMISPFVPHQVREVDGRKVVSFGTSSYGYDMRLGYEAYAPHSGVLDPKRPADSHWLPVYPFDTDNGAYFEIPPHGFILTKSVETWHLPDDVTGVCLGKSTYARLGIVVNTTPLEAGWKGVLNIEISNTSNLPARVYIDEGIAQCLFYRGATRCLTTYADRDGKYQDQAGVMFSRV